MHLLYVSTYYVSICRCLTTCTYDVCTYVRMCLCAWCRHCTHACRQGWVNTCTCVSMHARTYVYQHICLCLSRCIRMCVRVTSCTRSYTQSRCCYETLLQAWITELPDLTHTAKPRPPRTMFNLRRRCRVKMLQRPPRKTRDARSN